MHFLNHLTVLSFAVAAIAAPQDEDDSAPSSSMAEDSPSSVMSGDMEPSSTDTSEEDPCLAACDPEDVCCRAECRNNPCPSEDQTMDTTACAKQCDQGSGSPADTAAYGACVDACISENFLTATDGLDPTDAGNAATMAPTSDAANTATGEETTATGESESENDSSSSEESSEETDEDTENDSQDTTDDSEESESDNESIEQTDGNSAGSLRIGAGSVGIGALLVAAMAL